MLPELTPETPAPPTISKRKIVRQILLGALLIVALAGAVYGLRRMVGPWSESLELISMIRSLIAGQTYGVIIATGLVAAATITAAVLVPVATVVSLVFFERRNHPQPEEKSEPEKRL